MASMLAVSLVMALCVAQWAGAEDLQVGSSFSHQLAYSEDVRLSAVPLKTRTKNVFYSDNSTRIIKGIWAVDREQSSAKVTLTSGGVGSSFVNVRLRSARGDGLDYQVQVFV